jgi:hypothetical protein
MKLTDSGLKLASVSEDGILIRIFNNITGVINIGSNDPANLIHGIIILRKLP